ncbi:MAG: DUF255 domain-containing protein [Armatimonadetes bacterium]|nr:DUF255 domain-containing protein [Armatimonadota bacterium]
MHAQALVRDSYYCRAILLAAVLLLLSVSAARGADVKWYTRVEDAQAAAAQSGKPVYLFIFAPSQKACQLMRTQTLSSPTIAAFLSANFECCAVDSVLTVNKAIIDRYAWSVSKAEGGQVRFGSMPAHVFTNAKGDPYFTFWGYTPPEGFIVKLGQAKQIVEAKRAIDANPNDARAMADLGHVLLEVEDYEDGRKHLNRAKELDPQNKVGALEDATLDLVILAIVDDPVKAERELARFMKDYPDSDRILEATYWRAVCHYAQNTPASLRQALDTLAPFRQIGINDPQYRSRWAIEADKLERNIRAQLSSN